MEQSESRRSVVRRKNTNRDRTDTNRREDCFWSASYECNAVPGKRQRTTLRSGLPNTQDRDWWNVLKISHWCAVGDRGADKI